jgi:hypothetical protein
MKTRREFVLTLIAGLVAAAVIITPVIADELIGYITKVDTAGKKLTVESKDDGKVVEVKASEETEYITGKGAGKLDFEKLSKNVAKAIDAGKKGVMAKITHEGGVASKIETAKKKAN